MTFVANTLLSAFAIRVLLVCCCLQSVKTMASEPFEEFNLKIQTYRGQDWTLDDVKDSQLLVVAFLGTECPLAKLYGPRLQELHEEFGDKGVAFVAVNSNTQDSVTEISAYVAKAGITFTMLKDVGNKVADHLGAERTPEVFVFDTDRKIQYRGRIDDQYLIGVARDKVRRRDLAIALEELLAGKSVSVPATEPIGCYIGRVKKIEPHGDVTYTKQVSRILNKHCAECHRSGEIAPFALTKYEDVLGWESTILEVIAESRMPPWFADPEHGSFSNDARLSEEEKSLLSQWVKNGMPEGDPADLPEPPSFVTGWRMAHEPDQVVRMRDKPFNVPAEGVVDYKYFEVDPGWAEDKYVIATEARPDNPAVVHHIIAYVIEPGLDARDDENRRMLVGYAPGSIPTELTDGTAMHIKAGSKLLFEMHYTPNGTKQTDHSYVGLRFTNKENVKRLLIGAATANTRFEIPPGDNNHIVTSSQTMHSDVLLLDMTPHMHLRGKAFRYEAIFPDGQQEILLDVPRYDFNWQLSYRLSKPRLLPRGTVIKCTAAFDNSDENPVNPDSTQPVKWGPQSFEEMMIGFFTGVEADESAE